MIKAKPVSDKFWVLRKNNIKIGEVNITNKGYKVTIDGKEGTFSSLQSVKESIGIEFGDKINYIVDSEEHNMVLNYPVKSKAFNPVWNLQLGLPLFTKKEDSKSWFAAGYYQVKIKNKWRTILNPKSIILSRNEYKGPFKTDPRYDSH